MTNAADATLSLPGTLVTSAWLEAHIDHPDLVVCDVRWYVDGRSGEAAYEAGHIPSAVWIDLDNDLAGTSGIGPGRHPLPSPEHFARVMATKGIGDQTVVVAYDDANGSIAARLWWMLHATGHQVAVLDGGVSAWMGELSIDSPSWYDDVTFTPKPWPTSQTIDVVGVDEARRDSGSTVILDARSAARFAGNPNPIDERFGHIPGATSSPWTTNIDASSGMFHDAATLRAHFASVGVADGSSPICYCGSGVTACHNVLALHLAGINARLYPGSWSDWAADPQRPVEPLEQ